MGLRARFDGRFGQLGFGQQMGGGGDEMVQVLRERVAEAARDRAWEVLRSLLTQQGGGARGMQFQRPV